MFAKSLVVIALIAALLAMTAEAHYGRVGGLGLGLGLGGFGGYGYGLGLGLGYGGFYNPWLLYGGYGYGLGFGLYGR